MALREGVIKLLSNRPTLKMFSLLEIQDLFCVFYVGKLLIGFCFIRKLEGSRRIMQLQLLLKKKINLKQQLSCEKRKECSSR